jgi:A/G-specific adenine glycosylase
MISMVDEQKFDKALLNWWRQNGRRFPWRETGNAYHILVSEVMLHRTKADQVVPVYTAFVTKYPTVNRLRDAPAREVKQALRPLGLRWRTALVRKMSEHVMNQFGGEIPEARDELESLPGVGPYIASAVRCFAFGHAEPLLDTNTVRIVGRVWGRGYSDGSRRSKEFRDLASSLIDRRRPREFSYAMLDLGATLCRPVEPRCERCPMLKLCRYGRGGARQR